MTIDAVTNMEVTLNGSRKSSRFDLTVSTGGDVSNSRWLNLSPGMAAAKILMRSEPNEGEVTLFDGLVESIAYDPINRLAQVEGRDYSSVLMNTSYQDAYLNQTASEIATQIAQRHGFNPSITPTTTLAGDYQGDGYSQMLLNTHSRITSEWDLLSHLAENEGFELFVTGTTLVFAPLTSLETNYLTLCNSDVKSVRFHRNCPLSSQTTLTVKSWNTWQNQMVYYTDGWSDDQTVSDPAGLSCDPATEIAIVRPNLTSSDAERLVQRYSGALAERVLSVEIAIPGEMLLKPFDTVTFGGNGSSFDADYIVRSVRRQFSATGGFIEFIHGFVTSSTLSDGGSM